MSVAGSMGNLSALTGLSMASHAEEMDPALADGHTVIYDREVPLEMRAESGGGSDARELVGSMESIKIKILCLGDERSLQQIRVELTSENVRPTHSSYSTRGANPLCAARLVFPALLPQMPRGK